MDGLNIVQRLAGGHFMDDLEAMLVKATTEALSTGKEASVTVKLKVKRVSDITATVEESYGLTLPQTGGKGALFFLHAGGLHAKDPRQPEMELRVVPPLADETKKADKLQEVT